MEIPLFLAMTAAELRSVAEIPENPAWMACHFSSYGLGISNIPNGLPTGAMLILNDRIPISGHDPELVAATLCAAAERLRCDSILLDFQRDDREGLVCVIKAVLGKACCPVGVSALYAADFDCPVLLPPIAPHIPMEEAIEPWKGRELWLELSAEGTQIAVTEQGSCYTRLPHYLPAEGAHREAPLHCHYETVIEEDRILFNLGRRAEDQISLQNALIPLGATRALALWQEMKMTHLSGGSI